jgi:hypothetical protein
LLIAVEDAAVICVDCGALPVAPAQHRNTMHLGYHPGTVCGIAEGDVRYVARELDEMCMDGNPEVWRQSPKPSSSPSHHVMRTVSFGNWFIQAVCTPLQKILKNGTSRKIIVLFYDNDGSCGPVAMSHLFERSLPDEYKRTSEHLSGHRWKFGFPNCSRECKQCFSTRADEQRAKSEMEAKQVMTQNCFALL